ncbi:FAD-binding and (Fe-S)-binding domain-containing protein [Psychroserpens sp.]|uniref:FAD-binding and (Fe-S)-binding domain-containing protein n=1 Tax=Psychroserpens sp. TaxID=2020870 RepID=UPI001B25A7EF|nr:FAD-binding and (Fe-S)-binding domain-containing protein [Psychroserpens sp.]MBO6606527.1 FAD-binding oxidoreductase [Psychroserpens sp.]MBO6631812.1 FAD-binding oxidoreductase [Psychroserpens sp.]MBO6653231.1 FAD-binding oxidoreductase [Psychroserpens sp.]MBO6680742.1 FAD-binding oxidoreductase [Psychroserpens sp.]MBO6750300.1 FAD-binding oxidoreductase [Psychroserpens sp.]
MISQSQLQKLANELSGELHYDDLMKRLYATDASVYRMLPLAVALPKTNQDIIALIDFANKNNTSIIPRTAGTSLAGQCVGKGIVVDVSKYFNKILDINETEKTVTVQPGVIRDELNNYLKPFGLFFGPNTSTSNRCMIGGMVGNNSSGTTSIKYGVTRDKVLDLNVVLSDGSEVVFSELSNEQFSEKLKLQNREGEIYTTLYNALGSDEAQEEIKKQFPKPEIHRRNTGYAIDELIETQPFSNASSKFNMCKLLAGSEGTLAFTTQIKLQLNELPPEHSVMVAAHFKSIQDCLDSVAIAMAHDLYACEMMDKTILDLTKHNKNQQENRKFVVDDPEAILMCELRSNNKPDLDQQVQLLISDLNQVGLSYSNPVLEGQDIHKANELRKAGLGLLGNMIGDKKAVACIEDTAVAVDDLANYIKEFSALMDGYGQKPVYYAHAGAGELHLRPILNLKDKNDIQLFRKITTDVAHLVKRYQGSMSGEHGDGIVRGEFVSLMIGETNYEILKAIKSAFDPKGIFNPGKIVDAYLMDESLRTDPDIKHPSIDTILDFNASMGILREAEKCNGSGDCRKLPEFGGTMCPSYRATRNEKDTTRARANALREFLTYSNKVNRFDHKELKDVFELCLSCKACASECPSSVDVAALKAEFQYQYHKANGTSFQDRFFANATRYNQLASIVPKLSNFIFQNKFTSKRIKSIFGIHVNRSMPLISKTYRKRIEIPQNNHIKSNENKSLKTVYVFVDEFTNHLESEIAYDLEVLIDKLGYKSIFINDLESGRSYISKGLLQKAKDCANKNISRLKGMISEDNPLIGIEPSAILTFKDEYLKLADDKVAAKQISDHTYLFEDFLWRAYQSGDISVEDFTTESKTVKFHAHCYQKALTDKQSSVKVLSIPKNYNVSEIPSGCCGMAGSFGYEASKFELSMAIGEQTLFPEIRASKGEDVIIAANGTSCRHQIKDGTQRKALHPITILRQALKT